MSDDLDDLLREARVPEPSGDLWRRLPANVVRQAFHPEAERRAPRRRRATWLRFAMILAPAAAGLAVGFFLWHRAAADPYQQLESGQAWREAAARYGTRVRAVVHDARGTHVVLADRGEVPPAIPIWLELESGGERHAVVTLSGQEITVGGRKFQVLADPSGHLILIGPDFFWSEEAQAGAAEHFQIRSHALTKPF